MKVEMKVRSIVYQETAPGKAQVQMYPASASGAHPGDMTVWIPTADMSGIVPGGIVILSVEPKPVTPAA